MPGAGAAAVQDGSAWWLAREAIDSAHAAQDAGLDFVRTRVRLGADALDGAARRTDDLRREHEQVANAMLTFRDQALQRMRDRPRRLMGRLLMGATQVEAAAAEGVTQSAVSALARGTGAGLLAAQALFPAVAGDGGAGPRGTGDSR